MVRSLEMTLNLLPSLRKFRKLVSIWRIEYNSTFAVPQWPGSLHQPAVSKIIYVRKMKSSYET